MADLVQFLRDRLDDEAAAADKAAALCSCHPPAPNWSFGDTETDGRILVVDEPHPQMKRRLERRWSGSYDGLFMAEHIVRHDPARVLASIDGRRRIVDDYAYYTSIGGHTDAERGRTEGLTYAVQCLALPYSGHLDYRDEWRPDGQGE